MQFNKITIYIGLAIFMLGCLLAFVANYNHYYEILLLGMFLTMQPLVPKQDFSLPKYLYLYLVLIVAGLIGDLVMGLWVTRLWSYSYNSITEYFSLYSLVYPLAGLVMVQSFLVARKYLFRPKNSDTKISTKSVVLASIVLLALASLSIWFVVNDNSLTSRVGFYVSMSGFAFCVLEVFSLHYTNNSLLCDIRRHRSGILTSALIATYVNFFIHEGTNIPVGQWVYETTDVEHLIIFGSVSLHVVAFWPLLLLLPLAAYYTVHPNNPFYKLFLLVAKHIN